MDSTKIPEYQTLAVTSPMPLISSLLLINGKSLETSKSILRAELLLSQTFTRWKRAGKLAVKLDHIRLAYTSARSNLKRRHSYEETLK